ncbi:uncharacterized protein LOC117607233 [Osmia lignaria lignaria]|uniref:uncharacterized protein LOC117607233 n=1 Tax=Osmia lignaria lignaria TaxID=1437193 RepID=UPI00402B427B
MDKKTYKKYKRRIAEAVAAIDNKPPKFKLATYYKTTNLQLDAVRVKEIDKENMKLLRKMNIITRTGGNVDCWGTNKIEYKSKYDDQNIINKNIMKDNEILLKNIRDASTHYPVAELIKSWKTMQIKSMHGRRNTPFHRIVSGYWCQGGDITKFNGSGGTSIYGDSFENENYNLRHAGLGVLSMCNDDNNRCDSKFNLTFRRLETVDNKHVVFGKVTSGISNISKIEEFGTKTGKPIKTVIICDCGVVSRK